jgi:hypothetical protein
MRVLRRTPSPAMVIALIALFVAMGGGAYAAIKLPKNSVGTKQLKKNAVTSSKIKASAVKGSKVANNSLTGNDILESSLAKVPSASSSDDAGHATNADNAGHATTADKATTATTANGPGTLPSGYSESGVWAAASGTSSGGTAVAEIQFTIPLAAALDPTHTIYVSAASAPHCPGPGEADPGYLCAYQGEAGNLSFYQFVTPGGGGTASSSGGAAKVGSALYFSVTGTTGYADGQWTVTAP